MLPQETQTLVDDSGWIQFGIFSLCQGIDGRASGVPYQANGWRTSTPSSRCKDGRSQSSDPTQTLLPRVPDLSSFTIRVTSAFCDMDSAARLEASSALVTVPLDDPSLTSVVSEPERYRPPLLHDLFRTRVRTYFTLFTPSTSKWNHPTRDLDEPVIIRGAEDVPEGDPDIVNARFGRSTGG